MCAYPVRRFLVGVSALLPAGSAVADQRTTNWLGGEGAWGTPASWSGGIVPNNAVDTYVVAIDDLQSATSEVNLNFGVTIDKLTVSFGDALRINNQRYLTLVGGIGAGIITNNGTIYLDGGAANTGLRLSGGDVTLTGGGTLSLTDATTNRIVGVLGTERLINENNTIQGAGAIGSNDLGLINRGTILANGVQALTISPSSLGVVNRGTMSATGAGGLKLEDGTFTNFEGATAGIIRADGGTLVIRGDVVGGKVGAVNAGTVTIEDGSVTGGTLAGANGGNITILGRSTVGGTLTNPIGGFFTVSPGAELTLAAGTNVLNTGAFALSGAATQTSLVLAADITLSGGGTLTLSDSSSNRLLGSTGAERLTNADNTIRGAGQLGVDVLALTNSGTIVAQGVNKLTIDPSDTAGCTNTGLLQAASAGTLRLSDGVFTNTGGDIEALSGGLVELASMTLVGGHLTTLGTGTIRATNAELFDGRTSTITLDGTLAIAAGNSPTAVGALTNNGLIQLESGATATRLKVDGATLTLSGSGSLNLGTNASNALSGLNGGHLTNLSNTISGAGKLGDNTLSITNSGTILANSTATLTVDPPAAGLTNLGTLRAAAGSTLALRDGVYSNVGGLIRADAGGTIELNASATIVGGSLQSLGSGVVRTTGTPLLDGTAGAISTSGLLQISNGDSLLVRGAWANSGTVDLQATSTNTRIYIDTVDVTLSGGGVITLADRTESRVEGLGGAGLTNVDNTISGAGTIASTLGKLTNRGTILANGAQTLTIAPGAMGVTNRGTLSALGGGTLKLATGPFTNSESGISGTIRADGGTLVINGTVIGGTVEALNAGVITIDAGSISGGTLAGTSGGSITVLGQSTIGGAFTNPLGSTLTLSNGSELTLASGALFTNGGALALNALTSSTTLKLGGDLTLTGGGSITFTDNGSNRLVGAVGSERLTNADNTIRGAGQLGADLLALTNLGTIIAEGVNKLTIDPSDAGGCTNAGLLQAAGGGTLQLKDAAFSNSTGVIEAQNGGIVQLTEATILGGTVRSLGTGVIRTSGNATLDGAAAAVSTSGLLEVSNGNQLSVRGSWVNSGTVRAIVGASQTRIYIDGTQVTLTGGGTIELTDGARGSIEGLGVATLINQDNTIRGVGELGQNVSSFTNRATIRADGASELTIRPGSAGFSNEGLLDAVGAGGLGIRAGTFTNAGTVTIGAESIVDRLGDYVQSAGSTSVLGELSATGIVDIRGGTLTGTGTISATVTNSGVLAPGPGVQVLALGAGFTQTATGTLSLDLTADAADAVQASGAVVLDGTLELVYPTEHLPAPGSTFEIISGTSVSGSFAAVRVVNAPPDRLAQFEYGATSVRLTIIAVIDGNSTDPVVAPDQTKFDNAFRGGIFVNDGVIGNGGVNTTLLEQIRIAPWLSGVEIALTWTRLEPQKDQYQWAEIDAYLAAYEAIGRRVAFKFISVGGEVESDDPLDPDHVYINEATPQWVMDEPNARTIGLLQTPQGFLAQYPVYWDEVYLTHLKDFIADFGARYGQDPRIEYFRMGGWQVSTNEPNFYAAAAFYMRDQIAANGMTVEFGDGGSGGAILVPGTPYESAIHQLIESYRQNFGVIPLSATIKLGSPDSLFTAMNIYVSERALGMVNTGLNEGDKTDLRAVLRGWHDNFGCRVGWGGITNLGTALTQAELDALGHTVWEEAMHQAVGIDGDPRCAPASRSGYVVVSIPALLDVPALQWAATRLIFKD